MISHICSECSTVRLCVHALHSFQSCANGSVEERCNSSALAMQLRLSCTNPLVYDSVHSLSQGVPSPLEHIWHRRCLKPPFVCHVYIKLDKNRSQNEIITKLCVAKLLFCMLTLVSHQTERSCFPNYLPVSGCLLFLTTGPSSQLHPPLNLFATHHTVATALISISGGKHNHQELVLTKFYLLQIFVG